MRARRRRARALATPHAYLTDPGPPLEGGDPRLLIGGAARARRYVAAEDCRGACQGELRLGDRSRWLRHPARRLGRGCTPGGVTYGGPAEGVS